MVDVLVQGVQIAGHGAADRGAARLHTGHPAGEGRPRNRAHWQRQDRRFRAANTAAACARAIRRFRSCPHSHKASFQPYHDHALGVLSDLLILLVLLPV